MKKYVVLFLVLTACNSFYPAEASQNVNNNTGLLGKTVLVLLDNNQHQATGVLVEDNGRFITIRLSNGKKFSYPIHRVSEIEEQ